MGNSYAKQLDAIALAEAKLKAKKFRTLEKALRSDSPEDMVKATQVFNAIQPKVEQNPKAFFIDPLEFNANLGYKDKPFSLTYTTLQRMSKTPIINSIIKTRKNQVADFAEPQENKYSTGFVIRKKPKFGIEQKMDNKDKKIAFAITDFILKGGNVSQWEHDDFDTFIRKIVDDSLTYDQMTFELIRNRRGQLESFMATDAATFRMADSYFDKDYDNVFFQRNGANVWQDRNDYGPKVHGYYPAYVQVYQNVKVNEFYPWELCFGVRNPSTSIHANGYGCSELEELINVVTSMLWGDEYNRRFFSQGSAPKGLLRIKGTNNEAALQQFKQQWQSMITGVMQAWKTPVVEADVDWIDLQKNNRDMEYSSWMEYLIKLACAIYSIDPSEIGWDISRSSGNGGLFEGGQEQRLKHSKDKGLYPLLKFIQRKINKYIIEQINPDFELVFVGLNGLTIEEELKMDIDKVNSFMTVNEAREKYEMKPLEGGDAPNNATFVQNKNASMMAQQGQGMEMGAGGKLKPKEPEEEDTASEEEDEETNPFDLYAEENDEEDTNKGGLRETFVKAFDNFLNKEENGSN
jgi:hypothetical protein